MNKEIFVKKMQVSGILFKYNVPITEAKIIGTFIEELEQQCKKQKEIINKTILELANIDGCLSNGQLSDRICNLIEILEEVNWNEEI